MADPRRARTERIAREALDRLDVSGGVAPLQLVVGRRLRRKPGHGTDGPQQVDPRTEPARRQRVVRPEVVVRRPGPEDEQHASHDSARTDRRASAARWADDARRLMPIGGINGESSGSSVMTPTVISGGTDAPVLLGRGDRPTDRVSLCDHVRHGSTRRQGLPHHRRRFRDRARHRPAVRGRGRQRRRGRHRSEAAAETVRQIEAAGAAATRRSRAFTVDVTDPADTARPSPRTSSTPSVGSMSCSTTPGSPVSASCTRRPSSSGTESWPSTSAACSSSLAPSSRT